MRPSTQTESKAFSLSRRSRTLSLLLSFEILMTLVILTNWWHVEWLALNPNCSLGIKFSFILTLLSLIKMILSNSLASTDSRLTGL